jgi:Domain of unknown function (DUF1877)
MSQSTTIYSVSKEFFNELRNSENRKEIKIHNRTKDYYTFQNSFMGIEFVLMKDQSEINKNILNQIFNPIDYLGEFDFENPDLEEMMDFMESGNYVPYLSNERVAEINKILSEITESEMQSKYNPIELIQNDIYPNEWNNENVNGESNNLNHLIKEFSELQKIINQASKEENYLLICSG